MDGPLCHGGNVPGNYDDDDDDDNHDHDDDCVTCKVKKMIVIRF